MMSDFLNSAIDNLQAKHTMSVQQKIGQDRHQKQVATGYRSSSHLEKLGVDSSRGKPKLHSKLRGESKEGCLGNRNSKQPELSASQQRSPSLGYRQSCATTGSINSRATSKS